MLCLFHLVNLEHHEAVVKVPHVQWELFGDDNTTITLWDDQTSGNSKMLLCKSVVRIKYLSNVYYIFDRFYFSLPFFFLKT